MRFLECKRAGGSEVQGQTLWIEIDAVTAVEADGASALVHVLGARCFGILESAASFLKRLEAAHDTGAT